MSPRLLFARPLVLAAALVLPAAAVAAPPSQQELSSIQGLMGVTPSLLRWGLEENLAKDFPRVTQEQRDCLLDMSGPILQEKLDDVFGVLFESSENATAWLAFAETPGGQRFMQVMQDSVNASVKGQPGPDFNAFMASLTEAETGDIRTFIQSPGGSILRKPFPDFAMTAEEIAAVDAMAEEKCGIKRR